MVSFLQIVDNPRQDVPLLAVLRSPLLGFHRIGWPRSGAGIRGETTTALCADDGEDSRAFLERLAQLRAAAGELTADRLLWKLYTDWQALAVFGAMEGGAQRRSNLLALYAYAGQLAAAGQGNLFDFVSYLHDLMESGDLPDISAKAGERRRTADDHPQVQGTGVPGGDPGGSAEGLQPGRFPAARAGASPGWDWGRSGWIGSGIRYDTVSKQAIQLALSRESLAEEMRILYVAMTRAKEKLICVDCMRFARNRVRGLLSVAGCPAAPEAVGSAKAPGTGSCCRCCVRRRRRCCGSGRTWSRSSRPSPMAAGRCGCGRTRCLNVGLRLRRRKAAVQERRYDLSAMELRYGHTAACTIPTKVTATQLKGRVLDEEIAEGGGIRPAPAAGLPEAPSFCSRSAGSPLRNGDGHASGDAVSGVGRPGPGGAGAAAHGSAASDTPSRRRRWTWSASGRFWRRRWRRRSGRPGRSGGSIAFLPC